MSDKKLSKAAELARRRAAAQQSGGGSTLLSVPAGTEFFSIKKGKYLIDILNYKVGRGNPWAKEGEYYYERTYFVHPNIGADNKPYVCPRLTANLPCPICEYRAKLMKKGAEREVLAALKPRERQLFNVVDVTNGPNHKVLLWDISNFCFGAQLNGEINDADDEAIAGFADWQNGFSLKLGVDEEKGAGYTFPKVNRISFRPRVKQYDASIEKHLICLDDILVIPDYDVLKKEFLLSEDLDEDFEALPSRASSTKVQVDDDEEEEEEEVKLPKKQETKEHHKPVSAKPSKPVEEEEEEEEEDSWDNWNDDNDDQEEEQLMAKKVTNEKAKKQTKKQRWDDDDEEEQPKKPVKSKPSPKAQEAIWDDDDEEDDEEDDDWDEWDDEEEDEEDK